MKTISSRLRALLSLSPCRLHDLIVEDQEKAIYADLLKYFCNYAIVDYRGNRINPNPSGLHLRMIKATAFCVARSIPVRLLVTSNRQQGLTTASVIIAEWFQQRNESRNADLFAAPNHKLSMRLREISRDHRKTADQFVTQHEPEAGRSMALRSLVIDSLNVWEKPQNLAGLYHCVSNLPETLIIANVTTDGLYTGNPECLAFIRDRTVSTYTGDELIAPKAGRFIKIF